MLASAAPPVSRTGAASGPLCRLSSGSASTRVPSTSITTVAWPNQVTCMIPPAQTLARTGRKSSRAMEVLSCRWQAHNVRMMRAVVYDAYDQIPTLRDVAVPECPPDAALIRVAATGVCRSDWHAWRGGEPVALPHVPGHELAGTVERVGADVRGWDARRAGHDPVRQRLRRVRTVSGRRSSGLPATRPSQASRTGARSPSYVVIRHADVNLVALA